MSTDDKINATLAGHDLHEAAGGYTECSCGWPTREQWGAGEHEVLHVIEAVESLIRADERAKIEAEMTKAFLTGEQARSQYVIEGPLISRIKAESIARKIAEGGEQP